jgi:hypothetical protein
MERLLDRVDELIGPTRPGAATAGGGAPGTAKS